MNFVTKILFFCAFIVGFNYTQGQGFHFSNTRVYDGNKENTLNVTSTMITADLEKNLGVNSSNDVFIPKLKSYFKNKFSVVLNNKPVPISSIEIQSNNKFTTVSAIIDNYAVISSIILKIDLLNEFSDQQNTVSIDLNKRKEQFSLDKENTEIKLLN